MTVNHVNKARDFEAWVGGSFAALPEHEVKMHNGISEGTIVKRS